MDPSRNSAELVANAKGLILDFDGPVCELFAGRPSEQVAARLRERFNLMATRADPLSYLRDTYDSPTIVEELNLALADEEQKAAETAVETPGIRRLLEVCEVDIAIASNNADDAIRSWLVTAQLEGRISHIQGRRLEAMKPDPYCLELAAHRIGVDYQNCVFVGDSLTDHEAAEALGMPFIALANKVGKLEKFRRRGCPSIVQTIFELLEPVDSTLPE